MISTSGGHSGCPIVSDQGIVAIHVGSAKKIGDNYNIGRLITFDLINNLQIWQK